MNCVIDWIAVSNFTMAGATFATGVLAVGAAFYVGRRQTEIQRDLADIERARIRHELFDRRMEFVRELRAFDKRIRSRRRDDGGDITEEDLAFLRIAQEAEYLFPRKLKDIIDTVWVSGLEYADLAKDLRSVDPEVRAKAKEERSKLRLELGKAHEEFSSMLDGVIRPFDD